MVSADGEKTVPVLPVDSYNLMAPLSVFEDAIQAMEAELPGFCPLSVPQEPVVCITPLKIDDTGRIRPEFSGRRSFDS